LADGRTEGNDEGINNQCAESAKTIRELEASLQFIRADHQRLAEHSKRFKDRKAIGEEHHQTMLDIAEKLRIAAETFRALRTGKKLERDTRALRDQTLAMAALLEPATQEDAA
jgi:DNA repair ATPase RecN